jgi:hypothetical protein
MFRFVKCHHENVVLNPGRRLFLKNSVILLGSTLYGCGEDTDSTHGQSGPAIEPAAVRTHPANVRVTIGDQATFQSAAGGSAPLHYQWRMNGFDIPGATGPSYTLPLTMPEDDGTTFSVIVSNQAGTVTSHSALLNVTSAGTTIDTTAIRVDSMLITVDEA